MVLVDTSVWVAHLRDGNTGLEKLLDGGYVISHVFIIGELALTAEDRPCAIKKDNDQ